METQLFCFKIKPPLDRKIESTTLSVLSTLTWLFASNRSIQFGFAPFRFLFFYTLKVSFLSRF